MSNSKRWVKLYQSLALLLLNTVLLLGMLNVLLYGFYQLVDRARGVERNSAGVFQYGDERLTRAYPEWETEDRNQLLTETWTRPYTCAPFTNYQERPTRGEFVNVHTAGFRWGAEEQIFPPDDDNTNIFVFGGSTTFGYGVADWETIPSALQAEFEDESIQVYNFGTGSFYSTLERLQFENLLFKGYIPDIAIFIDGINEGQTEPFGWDYMRCGETLAKGLTWSDFPMKRLADSIQYRLGLFQSHEDAPRILTSPNDLSPSKEEDAIQQWMLNRRLTQQLAAQFGVKVLFVWQPDPRYNYDLSHHIFRDPLPDFPLPRYEYMASLRSEWATWADFLYLADLQVGRTELLYVDALHYNAHFNAEIAHAIAEKLGQLAEVQ